MELTYIFGHKNPDTDSVTAAITLSYLKNKLGFNTVPMVLGTINKETEFVLNYFNIKKPKYLNDVKLQIKDLNYHRNYYALKHTSIKKTYEYMLEKNITGLPIVDSNKKFEGLVTIKNICKELINGDFRHLKTSLNNILEILNGEVIYQVDEEIEGNIITATYRSTTFLEDLELKHDTILIVGDRHSLIEYAVNSGIKLLILIGNREIKEEHLEIAKKNRVNIIKTPYDSFNTSKLINLSNYIDSLIEKERIITFSEYDYYEDFIIKSNKLGHNNYPVVDKNNICHGLIRITDLNEKHKKKVILVDHNEASQSALGLDEAEIIETVDHHNLGNLTTTHPINFRIMTVGSTNTIIYSMYLENKIEIPYNIAGLMLSGILSDTLALTSPTTTETDKTAIEELTKILNIDYHDYAISMFKAGTSLIGKTKEQIVNEDIKIYPIDDRNLAISQVFTLNVDEILKEQDKYIAIIEELKNIKNCDIIILCVTDIIKNGSYFFYTENTKSILENAFNIDNFYQGYYVDGCVSRKKQIVSAIMEVLTK